MEYTVEFDTIDDGWFECWYDSDDITEVIGWVAEDLEEHGGGHADIYDEDGEFVDEVEV